MGDHPEPPPGPFQVRRPIGRPPHRTALVPRLVSRTLLLAFLLPLRAPADMLLSHKESWTSQDPAAWSDSRPGEAFVFSFSGAPPDGHGLAAAYDDQAVLLPDSDAFVATALASGGRFAGDYFAHELLPDSFRFDFFAADVLPSHLLLRWTGVGGGSTNTWFASLSDQVSSPRQWSQVNVPLAYDSNRWHGADGALFGPSLEAVTSVEVCVTRSGTRAQSYLLDNFQLVKMVPPVVATNDVDGDGLPDYWELAYFGTPTGAVPHVHSDSDTYSDEAEFHAGTDPTDPWSIPRIVEQRYLGSGLWEVMVGSEVGRSYRLEWTDDSGSSNWVAVSHGVRGTGGYTTIQHLDPAGRGWVRLLVHLSPAALGETSPYWIRDLRLTPTEVEIGADYTAGQHYSLWWSGLGLPPAWHPMASPPVSTNAGAIHFTVPRAASGQQVYRVHRYAP